MTGLLRRLVLATTLALVLPAAAFAGTYTLHPNGFGEHSYSAWKGGEGLRDSTGAKNQALYFQKNTSTVTEAAGVAVFKGVEGLSTVDLGDLSFFYRTDGHCGGGAPRFNLRVDTGVGTQTYFFACNSEMTPTGRVLSAPNGRTYVEKHTGLPLPTGTVVSLSLVFDEGNDVGRCNDISALLGGESCVYLDNITVANHVWTSASDNANADGSSVTIVQSSTPLAVLLGEPIALALGY